MKLHSLPSTYCAENATSPALAAVQGSESRSPATGRFGRLDCLLLLLPITAGLDTTSQT